MSATPLEAAKALNTLATNLAAASAALVAQLTPAAPVTVTVSPATVSLQAGKTQQFVAGEAPGAWSVSGPGAVSSTGLYTAPAAVPVAAVAHVHVTVAGAVGSAIVDLVADVVVAPPPPPPPPPAPSGLYEITEGSVPNDPGVVRDYFYAGGIAPWRQRGGDWIDANGVMWGPKPVAEAPAVAGAWCEIDCTLLGEQLVVRNLRGQAARVIHGRRGQHPPEMVVDGKTLPCLASAVAAVSSAVNANLVPTFALADGVTLFLRFAPVKLKTEATLRLWVEKAYGGAANLGVFRLVTPVPALAGDMSTGTLEGVANLYYQTASFDESEYDGLRDTGQQGTNRFNQYDWVDAPDGRSLRIWMDPRQGMVFNETVPFPESNEVAFEYDVLHLSGVTDHGLKDSGKMPGFRSATKPDDRLGLANSPKWSHIPPGSVGTLAAGNGGAKVHGNDGWSLRGAHGIPYVAGHPLEGSIYMGQYAYHADMQGLYGDSWAWTQRSPMGAPLGKWCRIYQRLKVNTPGLRDGVLEVRMDGRLAFLKSDLYLRSDKPWSALKAMGVETQGGCRSIWMNMWHGGTSMPLKRFPFVQLRNLKVALLG